MIHVIKDCVQEYVIHFKTFLKTSFHQWVPPLDDIILAQSLSIYVYYVDVIVLPTAYRVESISDQWHLMKNIDT